MEKTNITSKIKTSKLTGMSCEISTFKQFAIQLKETSLINNRAMRFFFPISAKYQLLKSRVQKSQTAALWVKITNCNCAASLLTREIPILPGESA